MMNDQKPTAEDGGAPEEVLSDDEKKASNKKETGGPQGPEPTRYGDWERKGRCVDF